MDLGAIFAMQWIKMLWIFAPKIGPKSKHFLFVYKLKSEKKKEIPALEKQETVLSTVYKTQPRRPHSHSLENLQLLSWCLVESNPKA